MKLTEEYVRSLSTPEYFERGEKYWRQGRVELQSDGDMIKARVSGTQIYEVAVDLTTLDFDCNCPAFSGKYLCKHVIAALLATIRGERKSGKVGKEQRVESKKRMVKPKASTRDVKIGEVWEKLRAGLKRAGGKFDRVGRDWWWDYVDSLEGVSESVRVAAQGLEDTRENCEELLKMAGWMDKHALGSFDDSDGILGDLQYYVVAKAVAFFDRPGGEEDLELLWKYMGKEYGFDTGLDMVRAVFSEVKNDKVVRKVGAWVEANFDSALTDWLRYLQTADPELFERKAIAYQGDAQVLEMLLMFYFGKGEIDRVVALGWLRRGEFRIGVWVEKALTKTGDDEKLIQFYREEFADREDKETLRKLKLVCEKVERKDWEEVAEKYVSEHGGVVAVDMLMMLKKYLRAAERLIESASDVHYTPDFFEKYARKLAILDAGAGLVAYVHLAEREMQKLPTSSFYVKLFEYLEMVNKIGGQERVRTWAQDLKKKYPNKKKLVEKLGLLT